MTHAHPVFPTPSDRLALEKGAVFTPRFDANGLVGAIVVDAHDHTVLMFAWMNDEALKLTIETRQVHFWSRSRAKLWLKGEESGNVLQLKQIRVDCDQDTLLLEVHTAGEGVACHTGARSCFYRTVGNDPLPDGTVRLD